ncbi:uncharacterized protein NPIL_471481 [Nephila pilipes]|uniref:Mutator-like transposase domain-containing protein n=1 Tax=Nephila pilipes TaxID=299642 RepID=A0A8X6QEE5_NEPPI|nr:uncharacterized protein NPIL_471481 [Nephila pilipes]
MRCIGKGAESAVMFCGIMNLPPPPTKFTKFNNILLQAARETCEESMAEAVHEAVEENEGGRDIAVAVDGSWQKRGFSSKNGVVTVTSVDTVGAPNMVGINQGFVGKFNSKYPENDVFLHCLIHQDALCKSALDIDHILNIVVKLVNMIRSRGLLHRQFQQFLESVHAEHSDNQRTFE